MARPINIFSDIQNVMDQWTTPMSRRMFHFWENGPNTESLVTREDVKGKTIRTAALLHHIRGTTMDRMKMPIGATLKNHLFMQLRFYTYDAKNQKEIQGWPYPTDHENMTIILQKP